MGTLTLARSSPHRRPCLGRGRGGRRDDTWRRRRLRPRSGRPGICRPAWGLVPSTSRRAPHREAANRLYLRMGFEVRQGNISRKGRGRSPRSLTCSGDEQRSSGLPVRGALLSLSSASTVSDDLVPFATLGWVANVAGLGHPRHSRAEPLGSRLDGRPGVRPSRPEEDAAGIKKATPAVPPATLPAECRVIGRAALVGTG